MFPFVTSKIDAYHMNILVLIAVGAAEANLAQILRGAAEEFLSQIRRCQGKAVLHFILRPTDKFEQDWPIWSSKLSGLVQMVSSENILQYGF